MAQRLMTKYNITMANIENDTPASKIKHEYFFSRAVLNPADTEITAILCRFYKVKILYNGNSGMVVIGTSENIEIAKYVHLSRSRAIHLFSETYGVSPYRYYQSQRLELAQAMLRYTSLSVQEISEKLGFSDYRHFSGFFKKECGMPPLSYRRLR